MKLILPSSPSKRKSKSLTINNLDEETKKQVFKSFFKVASKIIETNKQKKQDEKNVFESFIDILKKPAQNRSFLEIQLISRYTESLDFFKKLTTKHGKEHHLRCCAAMKYEFAEKGTTIVKYDTLGKNFYIILTGTVSIMTPSLACERRKNSFDNMKLLDRAIIFEKKGMSKKKENNEIKNNDYFPSENMLEIRELIAGETFGEYSLIHNKPTQHQLFVKKTVNLLFWGKMILMEF